MNEKKREIVGMIILSAAVLILFSLVAREIRVTSDQKFEEGVNRNRLAVILFYDNKGKDAEKTQRMLQEVSETTFYRRGLVAFIFVDVTKTRDFNKLAKNLEIAELPAVVLFEKGEPLRTETGDVIMLTEFASKSDIRSFIDLHMEDAIEENMKRKKKMVAPTRTRSRTYYYQPERERTYYYVAPEKETEVVRYYEPDYDDVYVRPYVSFGYPYYGYGYPYGYYPYYGYGYPYGGGVGFGFSIGF